MDETLRIEVRNLWEVERLTMRQIAEKLRLGRKTVSRILSGEKLVRVSFPKFKKRQNTFFPRDYPAPLEPFKIKIFFCSIPATYSDAAPKSGWPRLGIGGRLPSERAPISRTVEEAEAARGRGDRIERLSNKRRFARMAGERPKLRSGS